MRRVLLHQIKSIMCLNLFPDIQCIFSYFKRVLTLYYKLIGRHTRVNLSYGNQFDFRDLVHAGEPHFRSMVLQDDDRCQIAQRSLRLWNPVLRAFFRERSLRKAKYKKKDNRSDRSHHMQTGSRKAH